MFKTLWQKGYDAGENGLTIAAMYSKNKVEAGSLASFELSAGYKAARRVAENTA